MLNLYKTEENLIGYTVLLEDEPAIAREVLLEKFDYRRRSTIPKIVISK